VNEDDPTLVAVAIDPRVSGEHPGLRVWSALIAARTARTPPELRERLRQLADRFRGPEAVALRSKPVPWAYRVLYRQLGIDPDVDRIPVEELVLERLLKGGFSPQGMPEDALALATLETGVPVWAVDADRLVGALELAPDDGGRLVLADAAGTVAVLFEPPHRDRLPSRSTRTIALLAVQAPGVDDIFVEEAVWTAASALPAIDAPS
jgi:DNA/RNA-binding domain of Phe-tRNA-synthetase-like protein